MDVPQLFSSLSASQFKLSVDGDQIVVNGSSKLTPEQKQAIKTNKSAILAMLAGAESDAKPEPAPDPTPVPNRVSHVSKFDCERFKQAFILALRSCRDHEQMETVVDDLREVARAIVAYRNTRSWEITYLASEDRDAVAAYAETAVVAEDPFLVVSHAEAVEASK